MSRLVIFSNRLLFLILVSLLIPCFQHSVVSWHAWPPRDSFYGRSAEGKNLQVPSYVSVRERVLTGQFSLRKFAAPAVTIPSIC